MHQLLLWRSYLTPLIFRLAVSITAIMYFSNSLVDRDYPSAVQNPVMPRTFITAACLVLRIAWQFNSELSNLGEESASYLGTYLWQAPFFASQLWCVFIARAAATLTYKDFFSYRQKAHGAQLLRNSPNFGRERRFYYQIACVVIMAVVHMTIDVMWVSRTAIQQYWDVIDPSQYEDKATLEARKHEFCVFSACPQAMYAATMLLVIYGALKMVWEYKEEAQKEQEGGRA